MSTIRWTKATVTEQQLIHLKEIGIEKDLSVSGVVALALEALKKPPIAPQQCTVHEKQIADLRLELRRAKAQLQLQSLGTKSIRPSGADYNPESF